MTAAVSSSLPGLATQATPSSSLPAPARGIGFARMLDAHRQPPPAAAEPEAPAADEASASNPERTARNQRAADEARARQLRAARQERPAEGAGVHAARPEAAHSEALAEGDAGREVDGEEADAAVDWLAALNLPPAPSAPAPVDGTPGRAGHGQDASGQGEPAAHLAGRAAARRAGSGAAEPTETAERQRQGAQGTDATAEANADRPIPLDPALQVAEQPAAVQSAAEQIVVAALPQRPTPADSPRVDLASAAQALSGAPAPAERPAEMAAPTVVHLPTPADAPEFKQALGLQLSVLARDGIQQAELHLNPADMGPISVQIALEGDQAKVDFGADSAATRQLIESGLPELAAALREAGFTLSGGGVHSQAQQPGHGQRDGGRGGPADADGRSAPGGDEASPDRPAGRPVRVGGVDLYA